MVQARARVRIRYSIGRDYCLDKRTEQWLNGGVVCASIRGVLLGGGNNPQRRHILTLNLDLPFLAPSL